MAGIFILINLKRGRPVSAVNSMHLMILTFFIHNVYGDFVCDDVKELGRLFETMTFLVLGLLVLNLVALKRSQLIIFAALSVVTVVAHTSVLIYRFYGGQISMYAFGLTCSGVIVIFATCFVTNLSFALHRELIKEVEDFHTDLENKVTLRTKELRETNESLVSVKDALWGEMELAKKIQTVLLPGKPGMQGYDISACMKPADEIGGDYYDVINTGERDWLVIGDVSGHGVTAGLIMMMVQTSIHSILQKHPDMSPSDLLEAVNPVISRNIKMLGENKYMTITVLACHDNGKFCFSGLHQDIMIYRTGSASVDRVQTHGMRIGVAEKSTDMVKVEETTMDVGDTMLLFTDGITRAVKEKSDDNRADNRRERFSSIKLEMIFKSLGEKSSADITAGIRDEMKGYKCDDDVTMMVIKRTD